MKVTEANTTWLTAALFLATLDETAITLPSAIGAHVAQWITFGLAVLALVVALAAFFTRGNKRPPP